MEYYDAFSSATHLFMALWATFAALMLVRLTRGHGAGRWAIAGYGLSMVALYLASGLYHGSRHLTGVNNAVLQKLDKSAIFLLIAGSYLPVFVYLLKGPWRWTGLAFMTAFAATGIGALWLLPAIPHVVLVWLYVGMGVIGLVMLPKLFRSVGWGGFGWIVLLGTIYVGGAVIELIRWPAPVPGLVGSHEMLHLADMAGTLAHFAFVTRYVIRRPPAGLGREGF
jgi:hemolysin III